MAFSPTSQDPAVMGSKPCIHGLRITLGTIVGLMASVQQPRSAPAA